MAKETYSVLLVDDSDDDRLFLRRALLKNPLFALAAEVVDGEAAMAYLAGEGEFGDRRKFPFPDLLLLDLKLPRKTGYEVLEWLQQWNDGRPRVVVLSGSYLPVDVKRCRELGADAYFQKEAMDDQLDAMIGEIEKLMKKE